MIKFLRMLIDFIFWWVVLIAAVAFIGYIAWPLLVGKFYTLCSYNSEWKLCRGNWSVESDADRVQNTIEKKTGAFFDIAKTAVTDVLSDEGGKKKIEYVLDKKTGTYVPGTETK